MMNIDMPKVIGIMMEYLVVVIGEVDEFEELTPDVLNEYILNADDLTKNMTLYPNFEQNGYDTPYLNGIFGKQILMFSATIFIIVPMIYVLRSL